MRNACLELDENFTVDEQTFIDMFGLDFGDLTQGQGGGPAELPIIDVADYTAPESCQLSEDNTTIDCSANDNVVSLTVEEFNAWATEQNV